MQKEKLIYDFFEISHSYMKDKYEKILVELESYDEIHNDRDIYHLSLVARAYIEYDETRYNKELYKMVDPIFEYLTKLKSWSVLDIKIYSMIMDLTETHEEAVLLSDKVLKEVEKLSPEQLPKKLVVWIHANLVSRILKADYFDSPHSQTLELEKLFEEYFEKAYKIAEENDFKDILALLIFKKGLFYDDTELVNKGLELSKKYSKEAFEDLKKETEIYKR